MREMARTVLADELNNRTAPADDYLRARKNSASRLDFDFFLVHVHGGLLFGGDLFGTGFRRRLLNLDATQRVNGLRFAVNRRLLEASTTGRWLFLFDVDGEVEIFGKRCCCGVPYANRVDYCLVEVAD